MKLVRDLSKGRPFRKIGTGATAFRKKSAVPGLFPDPFSVTLFGGSRLCEGGPWHVLSVPHPLSQWVASLAHISQPAARDTCPSTFLDSIVPLSPYYAMKDLFGSPFSLFADRNSKGGENLIFQRPVVILMMIALFAGFPGCSSKPAQLPSPEARLAEARRNFEKKRYELAVTALEELRPVTTGTRLGGEVGFLLAETRFMQGKYAEAEADYNTYLDQYPEGPFSEKALYMSANSKIKQIRKVAIGLFTFRSYIPNDRDVSSLIETRGLFDRYLLRYPSGEWAGKAREMSGELLEKEGEHGLKIITFYLKKKQPQAALARANRLCEGDFPEGIKTRARELAAKAREMFSVDADPVSP
jgi:outer membrane assembly lipoprotein YfiO